MTTKKTLDRIDVLENRLIPPTKVMTWCGHEACRWKIEGFKGMVVRTGVPRPSCDTGNLEDDRHIFGRE